MMVGSKSRETIRDRANGACEYCRVTESILDKTFHVEHIVAKQHGGSDEVNNLAFACDRCNSFKGPNLASVDPLTGGIVLLFHPRTHLWRDHFYIERGRVTGRTPVGRATVNLRQMNAIERVTVRLLMIDLGYEF